MLSYLDRIQIVVPDRKEAVARFADAFGAVQVGEDGSRHLNAHRTTVQAGRSLFELLEPAGDGPVQAFRERWGQGLYGAGFATPDLGALTARLADQGEPLVDERDAVYLAEARYGMPTVLVQDEHREPVGQCVHHGGGHLLVQDRGLRGTVPRHVEHGLDGLQVRMPVEHREAREQLALRLVELLVAPRDRVS